MRAIALLTLKAYKRLISPLLPPACRFQPTCSEYCAGAVARFGAARGLWLGFRRLLRCQPFGAAGFDQVPEALTSPEAGEPAPRCAAGPPR